jgi:hypothetical protein
LIESPVNPFLNIDTAAIPGICGKYVGAYERVGGKKAELRGMMPK